MHWFRLDVPCIRVGIEIGMKMFVGEADSGQQKLALFMERESSEMTCKDPTTDK